jgi:hypothetical protein
MVIALDPAQHNFCALVRVLKKDGVSDRARA